jgi:DNA-binding beta-propeller fold protein YncE
MHKLIKALNGQGAPKPNLIVDGGLESARSLGDLSLHATRLHLRVPIGVSFLSVDGLPPLVIVALHEAHEIRVYDGQKLVYTMGRTHSSCGDGEGEFRNPWGVVVTRDSRYIVVSEALNNRLQVLALVPDHKTMIRLEFVCFIGEGAGSKPGELRWPTGMALRGEETQTILVAEYMNQRVSEFTLDGNFVRFIGEGGLNQPSDVAVLPLSGNIVVAEAGDHCVSIFNGISGKHIRKFGREGEGADGHFSIPTAVAADAHGALLVLDMNTARLQCFDEFGWHLGTQKAALGISAAGAKGIAWDDATGCVAFGNGPGNNIIVFNNPIVFSSLENNASRGMQRVVQPTTSTLDTTRHGTCWPNNSDTPIS